MFLCSELNRKHGATLKDFQYLNVIKSMYDLFLKVMNMFSMINFMSLYGLFSKVMNMLTMLAVTHLTSQSN